MGIYNIGGWVLCIDVKGRCALRTSFWVSRISVHSYLEGQGDLVSRLIMGITRVTIWVIWVTNLLTKSP